MTISQWSEWFDLISDKVGSAYYSNTEKDAFFNRAIREYVAELVQPNKMKTDRFGEKAGHEKDDVISYIMSKLTFYAGFTSDVNGQIKLSVIEPIFVNGIIKFESIVVNGVVAKMLRANDREAISKNTYTKPTLKTPYYILGSSIEILPKGTHGVGITVIRNPERVSIDENANCELPDSCHNDILKKALAYAGISYRDEFLYAAKSKE